MNVHKRNVLFRADGNSSNGLGHLYRLFSIAEMIKGSIEFLIVIQESTLHQIIPNDYSKVIIPKEIDLQDEPNWMSENFKSSEHIIIADGYHFDSSYQKKLKDKGYIVIYIDDLAQEYMYADVVINHSGAFRDLDYKKKGYTQLALGSEYALLRPEFLNFASQDRSISKVNTAFVCFGGADPFDLTKKTVEALLELYQIEKINVVIGKAYSGTELYNLVQNTEKVEIFENISAHQLIEVMNSCNIGIVPCSTILYELCCIKMPVLSGYYVDNQKYIYNDLLEKKVIYNGGNFKNYESADFKNKLSAILSEDSYESHLKNQKTLIDGKSKARLLGLVNQFIVSFRKAEEKDLKTLFNWSNDSLVRKNSFNSDPILLQDHKKWYLEKIKNKNTLFLIALVNKEPAGVVRFEIGGKKTGIGILIDKSYRGQGMASVFLRKSSKLYFSKYKLPIFAYIKDNNLASLRSFRRAGYKYYGEEVINGSNSHIYTLEINNENR